VELQGTAEGEPFTKEGYDRMIDIAEEAIEKIIREQKKVLGAELSGRVGTI